LVVALFVITVEKYLALGIMLINREIWSVIYTLFKLFGGEYFRKESPISLWIMKGNSWLLEINIFKGSKGAMRGPCLPASYLQFLFPCFL